jgi:tripartite-type tricarboxylate transporter receptor subunit TctC
MLRIKSLPFKILGTLLALSAALAVSMATVVLAADAYPSKYVRLIIPWGPGGSSDLVGRRIAVELAKRLGQQVVAENRVGAAGVIGTEIVAKAAPDGYTLLLAQSSHTVQPALQKLPFDAVKSFTPIAMIGSAPLIFAVHPSVPAKSLKEFIALAKQKPGQLIFAGTGAGSSAHLGTELFMKMADIDCKIVQFKGGAGPALIDVLGGHSHALMGVSVTTPLQHIKSGMLRALATTGKKRSAALPDIPTVSEAGVSGYEGVLWWGILAPAGTPAPIAARLTKEIKAILSLDDVKKFFLAEAADGEFMGPKEFTQFLEEEISQWTNVVKKGNIQVER